MSKIEWTDETWNPVTGCTKVSTGCKNCYAERISKRFNRSFDVTLHRHRLDMPLHWRKPRRVFINSMSDLFHADVPDRFIDQVFAVMGLSPRHIYQVLTKRPDRILAYMDSYRPTGGRGSNEFRFRTQMHIESAARELVSGDPHGHVPYDGSDLDKGIANIMNRWPLPNVHLGVSCENQETANERIPLLLQTPAAVRFVSCEPLLGPIDLARIKFDGIHLHALHGGRETDKPWHLNWVIIGCESGPKRRPCKLEWVKSIVDQCDVAGVPVFVKQIDLDGRVSKNMDEWPTWARRREYPR